MPCSPGRRSRTREQTVSISSASACDALTAISTPPSKPFSERLAYLDPARARGAAAQLGTEPAASARLWQENRRKHKPDRHRKSPSSLTTTADRPPGGHVVARPAALRSASDAQLSDGRGLARRRQERGQPQGLRRVVCRVRARPSTPRSPSRSCSSAPGSAAPPPLPPPDEPSKPPSPQLTPPLRATLRLARQPSGTPGSRHRQSVLGTSPGQRLSARHTSAVCGPAREAVARAPSLLGGNVTLRLALAQVHR